MSSTSGVGNGHESRGSVRFSLRTGLLAIALVACILTICFQGLRIVGLERSLSRYDPASTSTTLRDDQYRIVVRDILAHSETRVVEFRIETRDEHFAQLAGGADGVGGNTSSLDSATGLHVTKATFVVDRLRNPSYVKLFPVFGGVQGYSVYPVPDEFEIAQSFEFLDCDGVYEMSERVDVFRWMDETYTLDVR